ncbi:MAG: hypothetical protein CFE28_02100 [Alphaproteobacteria bacterium PA2]|nr:MAG: hypothetical protein CFE28_02100 [Alphaproteobacteria bacterium PA2]
MRQGAIISLTMLAALSCFSKAFADPGSIVVTGYGEVRTPPDIATATFDLRGEGASPDIATTNLVKKSDAVIRGISAITKAKLTIATSKLNVTAVRAANCDPEGDGRSRLSAGACAVSGYLATMEMTAEISPPTEAGTVLGLAVRLGGENANLYRFSLRDPTDAQRQALTNALSNARSKALAIAEGAGMHLGPLLNVRDRATEDYGFSDNVTAPLMDSPVAMAIMPPPVPVVMNPEPVLTSAQIIVTYSVAP